MEITFNGKIYTLATDADHTGRHLPSNDNYSQVDEGESYNFEMSAEATNATGERYIVYWMMTDTKGDEAELDDLDYTNPSRVERKD